MNIAFFTETFYPQMDGVVTRLCVTIKILLNEGHNIIIFAPERGLVEYSGARIVGINGIDLPFYPDKQCSFPNRRIYSALKAFQPDIIHAVNPLNVGAFGVYYAKKMGLPLVSSYHAHIPTYARYYHLGFMESAAWRYLRWLHNQSHLNLCTSTSVKEELQRQQIRRVHLWKRGVDRDKFNPKHFSPEMRKRLSNQHPEQVIFLYVGRLGFEKGLERFRPVLDANPDITLAFVGDGPARVQLERLYAGTNTFFTGCLYGEELAQAYASADAFFFPSTTDTLGLVLLEAMASGLPIVAANSGPTREMLTDGESAMLFEPDQEEDLLKAALTLAENRDLRRRLGKRALASAEELDWHRPTKQLCQYYERTIQIHRRFENQQHLTKRKKLSLTFTRANP
jgi:glycosyltransferase involved in cell wall biosynthesis